MRYVFVYVDMYLQETKELNECFDAVYAIHIDFVEGLLKIYVKLSERVCKKELMHQWQSILFLNHLVVSLTDISGQRLD